MLRPAVSLTPSIVRAAQGADVPAVAAAYMAMFVYVSLSFSWGYWSRSGTVGTAARLTLGRGIRRVGAIYACSCLTHTHTRMPTPPFPLKLCPGLHSAQQGAVCDVLRVRAACACACAGLAASGILIVAGSVMIAAGVCAAAGVPASLVISEVRLSPHCALRSPHACA